MLCNEVLNYISSAKGLPFFYVVGDEDYGPVLEELRQDNLSIVKISDFCNREDKLPSIDDLVDYFRTSDVDYRDNKCVLIGLGEYLALRGANFAEKELRRLKNTTLGNARVILLLRGVSAQASAIIHDDNRMIAQQRAYISKNSLCNVSITNIPDDLGVIAKGGVKELLRTLEAGASGNVFASTSLILNNALFPIQTISGAFSVVKMLVASTRLESDFGTEDKWTSLLKDLKKCNNSIESVFVKYSINEEIMDEFYLSVSGVEYRNWLIFLYFKLNADQIQNSYLRLVVSETTQFEVFKENLLIKIIDFTHKDQGYMQLYSDRKRLLKDFPQEEIAIFIKRNEVDPDESIYRLTDNTLLEKKVVVKWVAKNGYRDDISYVYPALDAYLKKYTIDSPVYSSELTEYFDEYKRLKVTNCISNDFTGLVEKYASDLIFAHLPTRDNAIKAVPNKKDAYLYWIDALGVEYLAYITYLAKKKGLSIHTEIVQSDLPTITSVNRHFYDEWTGDKKYKEKELDEIKHKDEGGYFFTADEDPIHIPAELDVIETAMNRAAMELGMHYCKSFVIASDHGASRLAVIKKQELPYDTDTKGEHSGRCCKYFDGCNVPYKVEDNDYIMLSDYGRFRGSRAANVEVHGGASLEEIVVPVITLTLKRQAGVQITVIRPDDIVADRHDGVKLELYISDVDMPNCVSIEIEDKRYVGQSNDDTHFTFSLKDIRRAKAKPYTGVIFDGEDLLGSVSFKVKGKAASFNEGFDFGDEF